MQGYAIQRFDPKFAHEVTEMWRLSMKQALGISPIHEFQSQMSFLCEVLARDYLIDLVIHDDSGEIVGLLVSNDHEINQLYLHPAHQRQGIGALLIKVAKHRSVGYLRLRTFAINQPAIAFYEGHGFKAIGGDCHNEEGLQDILYEWCSGNEICG